MSFVSHSHTMPTSQPARSKAHTAAASRFRFLVNLSSQNAVRVLGVVPPPGCRRRSTAQCVWGRWLSLGRTARPPQRRGPRGRAGSTLGSTRRVAGTTSEDLRSEGYTDRGRGTYSSWPRRATSRLSFCARPKRLSSARKPPSSLRPSSVGASSSAWRRTRSPLPGWPQPPAAARKSAEPRASPERRSRASCRRRSTPRFQPAGARSHFGGRRLPLL